MFGARPASVLLLLETRGVGAYRVYLTKKCTPEGL